MSEIISYPELVAREKANLQKGMNPSFGVVGGIILDIDIRKKHNDLSIEEGD